MPILNIVLFLEIILIGYVIHKFLIREECILEGNSLFCPFGSSTPQELVSKNQFLDLGRSFVDP
ncbi:MAG: hypothetical protein A2V86_13450 [Deltaproteobacteria bacterium RBG_16_49_23]|nr:MAG: hypothetical protein A2V86_13450 [Deltaproteobacteria bacterium RBG_16_49_23]